MREPLAVHVTPGWSMSPKKQKKRGWHLPTQVFQLAVVPAGQLFPPVRLVLAGDALLSLGSEELPGS